MKLVTIKSLIKWFYYFGLLIIFLEDVNLVIGYDFIGIKPTNFFVFFLGFSNASAVWIWLTVPKLVKEVERQMKNNIRSPYLSDKVWDAIKYLDPDQGK